MLSDAGIDVIIFDVTNQVTYGPHLPPEVEAQRTRWRELVKRTFLGDALETE